MLFLDAPVWSLNFPDLHGGHRRSGVGKFWDILHLLAVLKKTEVVDREDNCEHSNFLNG